MNRTDRFFLRHDPHLLLKLFLPYHLAFGAAKLVWMLWHLIAQDAHKLEYDPRSQWSYHLKMTWFWVANFPFITVMYFGFPHQWVALGLLLNTYYSLYANFDTEFGAIPAAYAAMNAERLVRAAEPATAPTETV